MILPLCKVGGMAFLPIHFQQRILFFLEIVKIIRELQLLINPITWWLIGLLGNPAIVSHTHILNLPKFETPIAAILFPNKNNTLLLQKQTINNSHTTTTWLYFLSYVPRQKVVNLETYFLGRTGGKISKDVHILLHLVAPTFTFGTSEKD